jgi:hypothetical protein
MYVEHPDFENITIALSIMKDVGSLINERRRDAEAFDDILRVYKVTHCIVAL